VEEVRFHPIPDAPAGGAIGKFLVTAYRSVRLRSTMLGMAPETRYRTTLLTHFFAWVYRLFNETGRVPRQVFAADVELRQTAALIDTAGRFEGWEGIDRALAELRVAFDDIRFEPLALAEPGDERILVLVRFKGVGRGSGLEVNQRVGHLFSLRDGSVVRWEVYWEEADALDAAGISASGSLPEHASRS
jgi:ketosteroid isomerase-like protein